MGASVAPRAHLRSTKPRDNFHSWPTESLGFVERSMGNAIRLASEKQPMLWLVYPSVPSTSFDLIDRFRWLHAAARHFARRLNRVATGRRLPALFGQPSRRKDVMRLNPIAFAAVFGVSLVATIPGFAQQQPPQQQQRQQERTTGFSERPAPIHRTFNSCVELAMQRGWSQSDIYDDRQGVRDFVISCMQGRQQ